MSREYLTPTSNVHAIRVISVVVFLIAFLGVHLIVGFNLADLDLTGGGSDNTCSCETGCGYRCIPDGCAPTQYNTTISPQCCPAFTNPLFDDATGVCMKNESHFIAAPILSAIGSVLFNVPLPILFWEYCICDNRCYPPQIVCYKKGCASQFIVLSYCFENYEVYCYCKKGVYKNPDNPCAEIWQEGKKPECCNNSTMRIEKGKC